MSRGQRLFAACMGAATLLVVVGVALQAGAALAVGAALIAGGCLLVVGWAWYRCAAMLWGALRYLAGFDPMLRWPTTTGTVVRAWTTRHEDEDSVWHTVHVEFTYELGDFRYTNRAARRVGHADLKAGAEDVADPAVGLARYRRGTPVRVHYDPREPERSVLDPVWEGGAGCVAVGGAVGLAAATLLGVAFVVAIIRYLTGTSLGPPT